MNTEFVKLAYSLGYWTGLEKQGRKVPPEVRKRFLEFLEFLRGSGKGSTRSLLSESFRRNPGNHALASRFRSLMKEFEGIPGARRDILDAARFASGKQTRDFDREALASAIRRIRNKAISQGESAVKSYTPGSFGDAIVRGEKSLAQRTGGYLDKNDWDFGGHLSRNIPISAAEARRRGIPVNEKLIHDMAKQIAELNPAIGAKTFLETGMTRARVFPDMYLEHLV